MVFNMKDNIKEILGIKEESITIKKAIESGLITDEGLELLKSNKDYSKLIEKLNKRRDPDNIEK